MLDSFARTVSFLYCDTQQSTHLVFLYSKVDYTESRNMALIVQTHFLKHSSVTEPHLAMGCVGRLVFKHARVYWNQLHSKARTGCGSSGVLWGSQKAAVFWPCNHKAMTDWNITQAIWELLQFPSSPWTWLCRLPICFISTALLFKGNITWERIGIMIFLPHG